MRRPLSGVPPAAAISGRAAATASGTLRCAAISAANRRDRAGSGSAPSIMRAQTSEKLRVRASSTAEYWR